MRLKLAFRHNEKDDKFHGSIVERIKLNAGGRSSECSHHFVESIGRTMWNGNAEPDFISGMICSAESKLAKDMRFPSAGWQA